MKHIHLFGGILAVAIATGCTSNPISENNNTTPDLPFAVSKSANVSREMSPASDQLVQAQSASINNFAVKMYHQIIEEGKNTFYSPYSISAALGMASAGAAGVTRDEILGALQATLSGDDFHSALNGLDQTLVGHAKSTDGVELSIVNSSWAQSGWPFKVSYLDLISRYYGAGVNLLDFVAKPEESRVIINTWVSDQTRERIEYLIPQGVISRDTRLVLTNAIYFLADWLVTFDKTLTVDNPFYRLDNSTVQTPLMTYGKGDGKVRLLYARYENARVLELPYKGGRMAMNFILPDQGSFSAFESGLTAEKLEAMFSQLDSTNLPPVQIPRFTFTTGSVSLVRPLKALGMNTPFAPGAADFSNLDGTRELYIADVIHKAFISVDESGTEAAAATAVVFDRTSMPIDPAVFIADRPFIYVVRDKQTNVVLFMGRVLDPTITQE